MIEIRNTITDIKNHFDRFIKRQDTVEKRISGYEIYYKLLKLKYKEERKEEAEEEEEGRG